MVANHKALNVRLARVWQGFDLGKYSEEMGNKADLEIECVWYTPDDEAEFLNEILWRWRWRKDGRKVKERKSTYRWANRAFTFGWGFSFYSLFSRKPWNKWVVSWQIHEAQYLISVVTWITWLQNKRQMGHSLIAIRDRHREINLPKLRWRNKEHRDINSLRSWKNCLLFVLWWPNRIEKALMCTLKDTKKMAIGTGNTI